MKKKMLAVLASLVIAVPLCIVTNKFYVEANTGIGNEIALSFSDYMRNVYRVTEHPELDEYVFHAFEIIESNKDSTTPIVVYSGDYGSCETFRDYFNQAYGYTYDLRLTAYRTAGSGNYLVGLLDTTNLDGKISDYLSEVKKAQEIAAQLTAPDHDATVHNTLHWVKTTLKYDYSLHGKATDAEFINSYYGFYSGSPTVCKGFSMAVYQLCSINGIYSTLETGVYDGTGHAWNTVLMSDGLKYVDVLYDKNIIFTTLPSNYTKR